MTNLPGDLALRATTEQLTTGLAQKHPLLTESATLPQALVTSLPSDLALRATQQQLSNAIATRQPTLTAQSSVVVDTISSRLYLGNVFRFWKADQAPC